MEVQTESRILSSLYLLRTLTYGPENQEGLSIALWLYTGKVWSRSNEKRQKNQLLRIFLFCLLVTLTFHVRSWKWIGLLYFLVAIHQSSFKEIGAETMEILKLKASEKERKKIIKILELNLSGNPTGRSPSFPVMKFLEYVHTEKNDVYNVLNVCK